MNTQLISIEQICFDHVGEYETDTATIDKHAQIFRSYRVEWTKHNRAKKSGQPSTPPTYPLHEIRVSEQNGLYHPMDGDGSAILLAVREAIIKYVKVVVEELPVKAGGSLNDGIPIHANDFFDGFHAALEKLLEKMDLLQYISRNMNNPCVLEKAIRSDVPRERPIDAVREIIARTDLPKPVFHCSDRFYRNVALALSKMKRIRPIHCVGWNGKTKSFELPQFRIRKSGDVVANLDRARMLPDDFPAKFIGPSVMDAAKVPTEPNRNVELDPVLNDIAIPFLVACELLVWLPMTDHKSKPVFVTGGNLDLLKIIAKELGVPVIQPTSPEEKKRITAYNATHRFPIFVQSNLKADSWNSFFHRHTIFHSDDDKTAREYAGHGSYLPVINLPKLERIDEDYWQSLLPLLAAVFYQRLCNLVKNPNVFKKPRDFFTIGQNVWKTMLRQMLPHDANVLRKMSGTE